MTMRSRVFLTPASANQKGEIVKGEVVELEYESEPAQFIEPLADNDDVAKLRADVHEKRAKLHHAKSRGKGVDEAQKALDDASAAAGTAHYRQQQERQQQRIGGDAGAMDPFSRQSTDTRQFAEIVDYSAGNVTDDDYDEADDADDDALEAKIMAAVTALEEAQSNGAPQAKLEKLAEALRVLREQLQAPLREQDPARRTTAPTGRAGDPNNDGLIIDPAQKGKKAQSSFSEFVAAVAAAVGVPVKKKKTKAEVKAGWDSHLADLDEQLKKRALIAVYPPRPESTKPSRHAQNASVCCEGAYRNLCPRCKAKKDAAA